MGGDGRRGDGRRPWFPDASPLFFFRQYVGFVLACLSGGLLMGGYDRGWMSNSRLMVVCLILALVGLFFHETRPFKRWENITSELDARQKQAEAEEIRKKSR